MILVVDLGTQTFRVTVLGTDGARHFEYAEPMVSNAIGDLVEQDPLEWKAALLRAFSKLHAEAPGIPPQVEGIAACGTLAGLVCLDATGDPLHPAMLYADRRPASTAEQIARLPEFRATGWRTYSGDFLPQIAYLRGHYPHRYQSSALLLDATGYLNYLLTGQATLDTYTAYTCYADPVSNKLPQALLQTLHLDPRKLGRLVRVGERIGGLRPELAIRYGFREPKVVCSSYDSAAAYLGAGLSRPGEALDISGTVTSFGVLSEARVVDAQQRVLSIPSQDGRWIIRGSTALAGGVLEWARREVVDGEFEDFDRMALASPPGANGVVFLPYLSGARSPLWRPSATGVFVGLTAQSTRADMVRAIYEGVCFSLRHITSIIESHGAAIHSILLGGGLARNPLLNQMKADITGKRLVPLKDTELTTSGAAAIVLRALKQPSSNSQQPPHQPPPFFRYLEPVTPHFASEQVYQQQFELYCSVAEQLFPLQPSGPTTQAALSMSNPDVPSGPSDGA